MRKDQKRENFLQNYILEELRWEVVKRKIQGSNNQVSFTIHKKGPF